MPEMCSGAVQLYVGSTTRFAEDTTMNRIAAKLTESFREVMGHAPSEPERRSWQNSLSALNNAFLYSKLEDHSLILEYQLPQSSLRLDCMIMGANAAESKQAVVIELKQWQQAKVTDVEDVVLTYVGGRERERLHPSRQVGLYQVYLEDNHTVFSEGIVGLSSCAFLHNMDSHGAVGIRDPRYSSILGSFPTFIGEDVPDLSTFLRDRLELGRGDVVLQDVLKSKRRPSRKLMAHLSDMVQANPVFTLLDEQFVVVNKVKKLVRDAYHSKDKVAVIVHGGPGTGKSVIAMNLLGQMANEGFAVNHATGSKSFTSTMRKLVGSRASSTMKYFNQFMHAGLNELDLIVADEAHRIREFSHNRFTPKGKRTNTPQVDEILHAAKVVVFFLDDDQVVRPFEIGSSVSIREAAIRLGITTMEYQLTTQFRCGGSDAYIQWINHTLGIRDTPVTHWTKDDAAGFDFQIMNSVEEVDAAIRRRAEEGWSARMTAGFCWPWSDPRADGTLVEDVKIDGWSRPWNAKSDKGRLAKGIPKENLWATEAGGIDQVGCIYTAQGFEFDYAGVIIGSDLIWRDDEWVGQKSESYDGVVKRSGDRFVDLVKNTYRVLLTRGMKGCYVYVMDKETQGYWKTRIS